MTHLTEKIYIAPSILSANLAALGADVERF